MENLRRLHSFLQENLSKSRNRAAKFANTRRLEHSFKINDLVWLLRKNIKTTRPSGKLDVRKLGPFRISAQINPVTFRLDLPRNMKIHPVFHVSALEKYHANKLPNRLVPPPDPIFIDEVQEYIVEEILDSRLRYGRLEYLVSREGYGQSDNTWEPAEHLTNAPDLVAHFHLRHPNKPRPHGTRSLRGR